MKPEGGQGKGGRQQKTRQPRTGDGRAGNRGGVGIAEDRLEELRRELREGTAGKSYGLINVNNRIRLLYGEGAGVTVESRKGQGTCVRIVLTELPGEKVEEIYG